MASIGMFLEGAAITTALTVNPASTPEYPNPPFTPGTRLHGTEGGDFIFVKLAASQTIAAGDWVYVSSTDNSFVVTSLANAAKALKGMVCGVAMAAATSGTTSYLYIWIQVGGYNASSNVATSSAANADLHTSATGGRLSGTGVGGTSATVTGVVGLATAASNTAATMLNNPTIGAAD